MKIARIVLAALVVAATTTSVAVAQVDFSKYVALGDSLTAGYASGGLAKSYQDNSYPAQLAKQFGMTAFAQPTVSDPGIPAVLELKALNVVNGSVVPTIAAKSGLGSPINATYAGIYNNLGIPGAKAGDLLTVTGNIQKLLTGNIDQNTIMYDIVLRDNTNPAYLQAIGAAGTFYTVWIGNNDVLNAALAGVALEGVTLTPKATFQTQYTTLLGALHQGRPSAAIVVLTVPDVASIPFVTTVKPYVYTSQGQKVYLVGEAGQLTDGDYVTLGASALLAQGYGLSTTKPLPEGSIDATGLHAGVILRAAEVAAIKARTADINGIIASVAQSVGAKVIDTNAIFADILAHGRVVGGITLTPSFLTGGIFSYDGVHPQSLGYALLTNEIIKGINAAYGTNVLPVNTRQFLLGTAAGTSVMESNVVFSAQAAVQLVKAMVPDALTDRLVPLATVRRHVSVGP